jgi:4-hydroxy-tetrahydrodipicolinate reductase
MDTIIYGDGPLGQAIGAAFRQRGSDARILGRPGAGRHEPSQLGAPDLAIEASRSVAVRANLESALAAGCRRFIIATTGWEEDRPEVEASLLAGRATAVAAPNLSIGAAVFFRLVERAAALLGPVPAFDPFVVEWHRRAKADRPSGTARELARRIVDRGGSADEIEIAAIRAGSSPGMHLVGFDAPGETIELRLTARDRSAYAAGALAAADWLFRTTRPVGIHPFDAVVDELHGAPDLVAHALAATA